MTALIARNLTKRFGHRTAVADAGLTLDRGTIACLLGPSGSGKSTLLRMLAGLERPDGGTIAIEGREVAGPGAWTPPERRGVGLVFQDYALFPHLDVRANIGFGLDRWTASDRRARVEALVETFRLEHRAVAWPAQLSGGEQQRVAIARALAPRPPVLLMDEPFAGLDGALRREVQGEVLGRLRDEGAAVLLVTHDAGDAMRHGDRLALMAEGRVLQSGTPEQCYAEPVSHAAAALLGAVNALPAPLVGGPAGKVALVRPEAIRLGAGPLTGEVVECRYAGGRWEATCRMASGETLLVESGTAVAAGPVALAVERAVVVG
jgi:iron(III) transport system ATP-binding protein